MICDRIRLHRKLLLLSSYREKLSEGMPQDLLNPTVYKRAYGLVRSYILQKSGNIDDIKDVYHEGLYIYFKKSQDDQFTLTCSPESYIFGICKNLWLKELGKRKGQILTDNIEDIEDVWDSGVEAKEKKEKLISIIQRNIKKLSQKCQELYRYKAEGLSCEQIASKMNLENEQISRNKTYKCKKRLLILINQDEEYVHYLRHE